MESTAAAAAGIPFRPVGELAGVLVTGDCARLSQPWDLAAAGATHMSYAHSVCDIFILVTDASDFCRSNKTSKNNNE